MTNMSRDTALVVIDVQVGMFEEPSPVYQGEQLLARIDSLLEKARSADIPIIYVQHGSERADHPLKIGTAGWSIHPAIAPRQEDRIVQKRMPDAFYETDLQQILQQLGVKKLVLTGIQTDLCVDTTCRRACSLDYDVTLVADAHSTWDRAPLTAEQIIAHHNALLSDWFATVKTEQEITFNQQ
jgi:nicotinamidase-related amidase